MFSIFCIHYVTKRTFILYLGNQSRLNCSTFLTLRFTAGYSSIPIKKLTRK